MSHNETKILTDYRVVCPLQCSHNGHPLVYVVHKPPMRRSRQQLRVLHRHALSPESGAVATQVIKSDYDLCTARSWIAVRDVDKHHAHVYLETQSNGTEPRQLRNFCAFGQCMGGRLQIVSRPPDALHPDGASDGDDPPGSIESLTDEQAHALMDKVEGIASGTDEPAPTSTPQCQACTKLFVEFAIESCGHLTRCVPCALNDRVCPDCGKHLHRRPRNATRK